MLAVLLCVLSVLMIIPGNFGCGGSKTSSPSDVQAATRGKMRLVIEWPPRTDTRLIPALTEDIIITVYAAGTSTPLAQASVPRPPTGTPSEEIFEDLLPGEVRIEVSAERTTDNVPFRKLATGATTAIIRAGETTEANIVMSSTIVRLVVTPALRQLFLGTTVQQSVHAEDSNGYLVLTLPQNITRQSDNESVVTIDANGLLTPRSLGTARITIRETESGVQTSYNVEVLPADPSTQIPPAYEITDLGVPANHLMGEAISINDKGQVVGYLTEGPEQNENYRAFLWENGSFTLLGIPSGQKYSIAFDINNKGQIAGGSAAVAPNVSAGWIWESGKFTPIKIPDLPFQTLYMNVEGINESGEIVGIAYGSAGGEVRYFRRSFEGSYATITTERSGGSPVPKRTDINEVGNIVYSPADPNGMNSPRIWRRNGEIVSLLPANDASSRPAITEDDFVVGNSYFNETSSGKAAYWEPGKSREQLFPTSTEPSTVTDTNNGRLIVGYRGFGATSIPFIVKPGQPSVSLNDRIPANTEWVLLRANGINQKGQIVGVGRRQGQLRGFVLSPKF